MLSSAALSEMVSDRRLHLILMPTEKCNFRCTYCYEDFALGRMPDGVVIGIKKLLSRRAPDLDSLALSWFGGEPLLARDTVESIMSHAQRLRSERPDLQLESDMTTNAFTLTLVTFRRLLELGVRKYQITFDGPMEVHDSRRVRINGAGSFARIWSNLLDMRRVRGRFVVIVRVHVDRSNLSTVPHLFDDYCRAFGQDERFRLFFRPLGRFGGKDDAPLPVFEEEEGARVIAELRALARARGVPVHAPEGSVCYAAHGNSFVIRADGRINKCTLALEHPGNQLGRIDARGNVNIDPQRLGMWMRGMFSGVAQELECPMLGYADSRAPRANPVISLKVA